MKIVICIVFALFSSVLNADISQYFKKAENKSDIHKMRNIDFIYLINLDKRPERLQYCLDQLHPFGIYPYRFSAVNGYSFRLDELNTMGVRLARSMKTNSEGMYFTLNDEGLPVSHREPMKNIGRTYFNSPFLCLGAIGCIFSHLSILQDAYDSNYETIWIMEDDIEVLQDPRIIPDLIDELDKLIGENNWDVLFTDIDRRSGEETYMYCRPGIIFRPNYSPPNKNHFLLDRRISPDFRRIGARCGTHSMIVRRSGMKKILDFEKRLGIFLPIDNELCLVERIQLYSLCQDVVSNSLNSGSDISQYSWDLVNSER